MSPQLSTPNREAAIWARLIEAQRELSPEVAEYLLSISFGEGDRERMEQLAELSEAGTLTDEERAELVGRTAVGRITIEVLAINASDFLAVREALIEERRFPVE